MYKRSRSKGPKQGGKPCRETGVKTGRVIRILTVKVSLLESQLVTERRRQATTWCVLVGSSARPTKGSNFNISKVEGVHLIFSLSNAHFQLNSFADIFKNMTNIHIQQE